MYGYLSIALAVVILLATRQYAWPLARRYFAVRCTIANVMTEVRELEQHEAGEPKEFANLIDTIICENCKAEGALAWRRFRIGSISSQLSEAERHAQTALVTTEKCVTWLDHCSPNSAMCQKKKLGQ